MTNEGKPRGVAGRLAAMVQVSDHGPDEPVRPAFRAQQAIDGMVVGLQEQVRGLSSDAVMVRQSWLKAYDSVTAEAAVTLND